MNTKDIEEIVEEFDHITYPPLAGNPLQKRTDEELIAQHDKKVEWLRTTLTKLTQHHEAEVERAVEAEAYNWFNRWYNSHIAKQNEKQRFDFAQWATSRLQELGVNDNGTVAPTKTDKQ